MPPSPARLRLEEVRLEAEEFVGVLHDAQAAAKHVCIAVNFNQVTDDYFDHLGNTENNNDVNIYNGCIPPKKQWSWNEPQNSPNCDDIRGVGELKSKAIGSKSTETLYAPSGPLSRGFRSRQRLLKAGRPIYIDIWMCRSAYIEFGIANRMTWKEFSQTSTVLLLQLAHALRSSQQSKFDRFLSIRVLVVDMDIDASISQGFQEYDQQFITNEESENKNKANVQVGTSEGSENPTNNDSEENQEKVSITVKPKANELRSPSDAELREQKLQDPWLKKLLSDTRVYRHICIYILLCSSLFYIIP